MKRDRNLSQNCSNDIQTGTGHSCFDPALVGYLISTKEACGHRRRQTTVRRSSVEVLQGSPGISKLGQTIRGKPSFFGARTREAIFATEPIAGFNDPLHPTKLHTIQVALRRPNPSGTRLVKPYHHGGQHTTNIHSSWRCHSAGSHNRHHFPYRQTTPYVLDEACYGTSGLHASYTIVVVSH